MAKEGHEAAGNRSGFGRWQLLGGNCTLGEDPLPMTVCALGGPWGRTAWGNDVSCPPHP